MQTYLEVLICLFGLLLMWVGAYMRVDYLFVAGVAWMVGIILWMKIDSIDMRIHRLQTQLDAVERKLDTLKEDL